MHVHIYISMLSTIFLEHFLTIFFCSWKTSRKKENKGKTPLRYFYTLFSPSSGAHCVCRLNMDKMKSEQERKKNWVVHHASPKKIECGRWIDKKKRCMLVSSLVHHLSVAHTKKKSNYLRRCRHHRHTHGVSKK